MKKKELLTKVSKKLKGDETVEEPITTLNCELSGRFSKENSIYLIIYAVISVISYFIKDKIKRADLTALFRNFAF